MSQGGRGNLLVGVQLEHCGLDGGPGDGNVRAGPEGLLGPAAQGGAVYTLFHAAAPVVTRLKDDAMWKCGCYR